MKRIIVALLVLALCFGLCACGDDAGLKKSDFVGTWLWARDGFKLVLNADGSGSHGDAKIDKWKYDKKTNQLTVGYATFAVKENNGMLELWEAYEGEVSYYPYLKSEDLEKRVKKVEITMDNWQDYFELVYESVWEENAFKEAVKFYPVVRLIPKDSLYLHKDPDSAACLFKFVPYDDYDVVFEVAYKHVMKTCQVDLENKQYAWGEVVTDFPVTEQTQTASLRDRGEALAEVGVMQIYSQTYYDNAQIDITDYTVTRVKGHLYIFE